MRRSFLKVFAI